LKKYRNAFLFVLALVLIGGLVLFSGGKMRSRAGTQTLIDGYYMGPSDHVSDWSGEDIVIPNRVTATIDGSHTFKSVTVKNGGTLTTSPAGAYRKLTRDYDTKTFYDHAWVMVTKGYYTPSTTGQYKFGIPSSGCDGVCYDDAVIFKINDGVSTLTASRTNLNLVGSPYNWPNTGDTNATALIAGTPYEITIVLAKIKIPKGSEPNDPAKLVVKEVPPGGVSFQDIDASKIYSYTSKTAAAMDLYFYTAKSTSATGIKYDSNLNFSDADLVTFGSATTYTLRDYPLFDAKPYYPAQQGPTRENGIYYTSRTYDSTGHVSSTSSNNEYDQYALNQWSDGHFKLYYNTGCFSDSCRYVNPIGYLSVTFADTTDANFSSYFTGFYTR